MLNCHCKSTPFSFPKLVFISVLSRHLKNLTRLVGNCQQVVGYCKWQSWLCCFRRTMEVLGAFVSAQNLVGCAGSLEEESVEGSTGDGGLAWWALARNRNSGPFVWLIWMKNGLFMISWGWTSAVSSQSLALLKWKLYWQWLLGAEKKNQVINRRHILEAESCGKYFPSVRIQKLWGPRLHLDLIMCKCLPCVLVWSTWRL